MLEWRMQRLKLLMMVIHSMAILDEAGAVESRFGLESFVVGSQHSLLQSLLGKMKIVTVGLAESMRK